MKAILNEYFDKIYVLTIPSASLRHQLIKKELEGLDFIFFNGISKYDINIPDYIEKSIYNEELTIQNNRYDKNMNTGQIACSLGHKMIYEDIINHNYKNALILEDDSFFIEENLKFLEITLQELPADWDIFFMDYVKYENDNFFAKLKKILYKFQVLIGQLKFNYIMIDHLFSRAYSKHIKRAGYHNFSNAYAVSRNACYKLLQLQTPIQFPSDHLLAWACTNRMVNGYVSVPKLFGQYSPLDQDKASMINNDFE